MKKAKKKVVKIDEESHELLRRASFDTRRTMTDIMVELIKKSLSEKYGDKKDSEGNK